MPEIMVNGVAWGRAPKRERRLSKPLLIVGRAPGWERDLEALDVAGHVVMALNRMGGVLHAEGVRVDHLATMHGEWLHKFADNGSGALSHIWNKHAWWREHDTWCWQVSPYNGSSALFAALIGLAMGFKRIVVAGVRLESDGYREFRDDWAALGPFLGKHGVRSCSGWLTEVVGNA